MDNVRGERQRTADRDDSVSQFKVFYDPLELPNGSYFFDMLAYIIIAAHWPTPVSFATKVYLIVLVMPITSVFVHRMGIVEGPNYENLTALFEQLRRMLRKDLLSFMGIAGVFALLVAVCSYFFTAVLTFVGLVILTILVSAAFGYIRIVKASRIPELMKQALAQQATSNRTSSVPAEEVFTFQLDTEEQNVLMQAAAAEEVIEPTQEQEEDQTNESANTELSDLVSEDKLKRFTRKLIQSEGANQDDEIPSVPSASHLINHLWMRDDSSSSSDDNFSLLTPTELMSRDLPNSSSEENLGVLAERVRYSTQGRPSSSSSCQQMEFNSEYFNNSSSNSCSDDEEDLTRGLNFAAFKDGAGVDRADSSAVTQGTDKSRNQLAVSANAEPTNSSNTVTSLVTNLVSWSLDSIRNELDKTGGERQPPPLPPKRKESSDGSDFEIIDQDELLSQST